MQAGAMREHLSFLLNAEPQEVRGLDPATTLRAHLRGPAGGKEPAVIAPSVAAQLVQLVSPSGAAAAIQAPRVEAAER
jgi:xanthine/CO dehydrogenase XdhC/CoxF family maturation factor